MPAPLLDYGIERIPIFCMSPCIDGIGRATLDKGWRSRNGGAISDKEAPTSQAESAFSNFNQRFRTKLKWLSHRLRYPLVFIAD